MSVSVHISGQRRSFSHVDARSKSCTTMERTASSVYFGSMAGSVEVWISPIKTGALHTLSATNVAVAAMIAPHTDWGDSGSGREVQPLPGNHGIALTMRCGKTISANTNLSVAKITIFRFTFAA